ncbi:hypothetical protein UNSWDHB_318 [Dehalobacter sp. UNSWDHB]|jgi:Histidine kinase-, DNA gyrase B-, and HSP90-like ATPase.|uniref:ATP-binding protein n=1 Tax=unclassified Dehalobacter TaxID=2635733 RepID=UPI00028B6DEB|nr:MULTISPECIES: ATP-binding protein [unclassified Dehalobacter]AFV03478.1 DNA mismatch repair enzyme (predicted ATPase) [Dehalobacter sp. DCA]AFV06465.1 DNA mismatch repair enzyme (predicted ATPase) [Dehalobacter sp. CF]EQB22365.1 hypothetical protein UNSWDHB_318 [Dehalobacter sp. UNSWDHB]
MSQSIINIEQYGDALRNTGYKNIESAVSEIIDNSIEAEATDVFVIVTDTLPSYASRRIVTEIAFLDNGTGMDRETLDTCLQIGSSTRRERRGMGRFGVGLPQASLHVCPRVEVYSWQGGVGNCLMIYLDINLIQQGIQTEFDEPQAVDIPDKYSDYLQYSDDNHKQFDFSQSGTLVVWKDCDNVSPGTVMPLFKRLEFALGQKFRHLIQSGIQSIYLRHTQNETIDRQVMPNDPLLLMKPNLVLGNFNSPGTIRERDNIAFTEPLFEPFKNDDYPDGIMRVPVRYQDRDTKEIRQSTVTLTFSVVRREFYDITAIKKDPGATAMGGHVKKLEGISVVRAGREIDFGQFDFYTNRNKPEHRWWGCEISFEPELDEAFGVSNNKQHVELIELPDEEYEDDELKPLWLQLRRFISDTISAMYNRNKDIRKLARTAQTETSQAEEIVNAAEEGSTEPSHSQEVRGGKSEEEVRNDAHDFITHQTGEEPSDEIIDVYLSNKINFIYKNNGRNHFFDYNLEGLGTASCIINTAHVFYTNFVQRLEDDPDFKTAFELFLASLVITIDQASEKDREAFDELITTWNEKLRRYINEQVGNKS